MPEANHPDLTALLARMERLEEELCKTREDLSKTRDLLALAHAEIKRKDRIIEGLQHRLFGPSSEKLDPAQLQFKLASNPQLRLRMGSASDRGSGV